MVYTSDELNRRYEQMTGRAEAHCSFVTELVGGQPAGEDGVRAFVTHHLKLTGEEAERAIQRILSEEIRGEVDVTPINAEEAKELRETLTYGITVIRRDEYGPWIGDWMVKACLKAAASRIGLFTKIRCKGDMAEMGRVRPIGPSLRHRPERIYLLDDDGNPAKTYFQTFRGRVSTAQGSKSIVSDKECAPPGTRFAFEFRWFDNKIQESQIADVFAAACNIGLGSAKAFERGRFVVHTLDVDCKGRANG